MRSKKWDEREGSAREKHSPTHRMANRLGMRQRPSGPILRDTAILPLRHPTSRDNFEGRLALTQNGAIPPLGT